MAVGDILQLTIGQRLFEDIVQNVLYYRVEVEPTGGDIEEGLTSQWITDVLPTWKAAVTNLLFFDCISTQKVSPDPIRNTFDTFISGNGDKNEDSMPARNCALIQKFNPAVTGKGKKGRVYVSGVAEEDEKDGRLNNMVKGLLEALANKLILKLLGPDSGEYQPVWVTRASTTPFAITGNVVWTNFLVKPILASQKRRVTPINSFQP